MRSPAQLAIVTLVTLVCIGCDTGTNGRSESSVEGSIKSTPEPSANDLVRSFQKTSFRNEQDVRAAIDAAANSPVSVSYIHLAWSVESVAHQHRFAQFALDYHRSYPESPVLFHFIDCTPITQDYSSLSNLPGWEKGKHHVGGWGEVMWMKDGRVIQFEAVRNFSSVEELVEKTASLFGSGG